MLRELRAHIERKMADARLERMPFPHVVVEGFFPDDVYARILEANLFRQNEGAAWFEKGRAPDKMATPYWARRQINFHLQQPVRASREQGAFWTEIARCFLGDAWFTDLVIATYREYFVLRFGELVDAPGFAGMLYRELFLQQHEPGFYIGPHTDVPTRVATCIFAFADRPGFEEYGTQLCAHRDPLVRCWGNDHYPPDDFVVRKVAPYKPNNFFLFFKTRQSFHAVKAIDASVPNRRYGMQFQLFEPRHGLFRDLSEPELLRARVYKDRGDRR
jgi:hypothetical protein